MSQTSTPALAERLRIDPAGRLLRRNLENGEDFAATGLKTYEPGNAFIHIATEPLPVHLADRLREGERLLGWLLAWLTLVFAVFAYTILVNPEPVAPTAPAPAPARGLAAWEWANGD